MKSSIFALCLVILLGCGQLAWADNKAVQLSVHGCNS